MSVRILIGDCREVLRALPAESVHCVVTSPPYWGLRDYGVEGQLGLEESPESFIAEMVGVFREVRRVLRADGTAWVNMGDSYASGSVKGNSGYGTSGLTNSGEYQEQVPRGRPKQGQSAWAGRGVRRRDAMGKHAYVGGGIVGSNRAQRGDGNAGVPYGPVCQPNRMPQLGFKPKDMCGIPWRLAFALQADGWWLRQDIIWHKPNPMPESIRDRCTKAHEYIFLFAKSERYFYDADAIREPASENTHARKSMKMPDGWDTAPGGHGAFYRNGREKGKTTKVAPDRSGNIKNNETFEAVTRGDVVEMRNKRSVWTVGTEGFPEAHFATFPSALIEPCILAGCPRGGAVLDPFGGAGTTGLVADRLQREAILIELNPDYAAMAERRIRNEGGMLTDVHVERLAEARADA